MPRTIHFEWELPDTLVDALAPAPVHMVDTIKRAAVLDWVRTHKISLRRGAELLRMTYREFLALMAAHRVPTLDYEGGWLDRDLATLEQARGTSLS